MNADCHQPVRFFYSSVYSAESVVYLGIMADEVQIQFIIHTKEHTVSYESGDSLLETAIRNDLNPPYSCMEGVCSACLARVQHGEVDYPDDTSLDESDVKNGLILTCQAKPKAGCSRLTISYDAV